MEGDRTAQQQIFISFISQYHLTRIYLFQQLIEHLITI